MARKLASNSYDTCNAVNAPKSTTEEPPTNYLRRFFGLLLAAAPFFLFIASIIYGATHETGSFWTAVFAAGIAAFIAALNFHCSFIRPFLYRRFHGTMDGYRFVSAFPIVGTIFAIIAAIIGFGAIGTASVCLAATTFDTGAGHWFVYSTWRDKSFWDA
jgi:hypothetical protein